jgi:hypothetical protein
MGELFNFNYIAMTTSHFHRSVSSAGSWNAIREKQTPTTREEIEGLLRGYSIFFTTTGQDQEYLIPILKSLGFKPTVFRNQGHHKTLIIHWLLDKGMKIAPGEAEALLATA